jgi:hypothetical protein
MAGILSSGKAPWSLSIVQAKPSQLPAAASGNSRTPGLTYKSEIWADSVEGLTRTVKLAAAVHLQF